MKSDVLLDLFFGDATLTERVDRIAAAGWRGVETWKGGNAVELKEIGDACHERDMTFVSIVMNAPGDPAVAPIDPAKRAAFLEQIDRLSDNALAAGCQAGIVTTGNRIGGDYYTRKQILVEALVEASEIATKKGFMLNLEPLNDKVDHAGYFLVSREEAVDVVREVNSANLRLLYDLYHQQVMDGDHLAFMAAHLKWIGHIHAAGVPGRHEIFSGEIDYVYVVQQLNKMGYKGWFGLEYMPLLDHKESLRKTAQLLAKAGS